MEEEILSVITFISGMLLNTGLIQDVGRDLSIVLKLMCIYSRREEEIMNYPSTYSGNYKSYQS